MPNGGGAVLLSTARGIREKPQRQECSAGIASAHWGGECLDKVEQKFDAHNKSRRGKTGYAASPSETNGARARG